MIFLLLIIYLIFLISMIIAFFTYFKDSPGEKFVCDIDINALFLVFSYTLAGLIGILFFIVALIDIILNFKKIFTCKLREYFLDDDPYYFRIEGVICFFIFTINTTLLIIVYAVNFDDLDKTGGIDPIYHILVVLLPDFIISSLFIFFPLTITIINFIKDKCTKKEEVTVDDLEKMLSNPEIYQLILEFSQSEWSSENLFYYDSVTKFQKSPQLEEANRIFETFLNPNAPCEINIARSICIEIKKNIDSAVIAQDLFEASMNTVRTNLNDTYSRFITTNKYNNWKKEHEIKEKMMKGFQ